MQAQWGKNVMHWLCADAAEPKGTGFTVCGGACARLYECGRTKEWTCRQIDCSMRQVRIN
jgi:hypothetical protein